MAPATTSENPPLVGAPSDSDRPHLSAETLRRLLPLIESTTERAGWVHAVEIAHDLLDVDVVVAVEYLGDDRGEVRSGVGFDELLVGTVIPIPPGSQARFALDGDTCVTGHLPSEQRFVPSPFLVSDGILSSMTMSIELPGGAQAIIGAHSRCADRFDVAQVESFESLGRVFGSAIRRLRVWDRLELNARIDPLTGLMNRASILRHLDDCFAAPAHPSALLIDIDGFKSVNDTLGHRTGDSVLRIIAERIERAIGPQDCVGRLGGDEFLLITERSDTRQLAERLVGHIEEVITVDSSVVQLSASVGIARRRASDDAMGMVERADRLMYQAKSAGRGEVRRDAIVDEAPTEIDERNANPGDGYTEADVDEAIAGLRLVVQPIIDPFTGSVHAVETLTRGPSGHPLEFPGDLFPVATTFSRLGDLELAAKRLAFDLPLDDDVELYVNIEPVLLCSESWMARLAEVWRTAPGRPTVTVELTERAVTASPGRLVRAVEACRNLGWKIALDDLGSRSESLAALRWIDPDVVKLDMSLISRENSAHTAHVVASVAAYRNMDRRRHVRVVAERVETLEDARHADVLGAELLQGYLFGRPSPIEHLGDSDSEHRRAMVPVPPRSDGHRIATKRDLIAMTRHVEATVHGADSILLASMQHGDHVTKRTRRQYQSLARRCGFVGIVGVGLSHLDGSQLHGVRIAEIDESDPMAANWHVVSISSTASVALLATEIDRTGEPGAGSQIGAAGDDMERRFRYDLSTDPDIVEDAARSLLRYF